MIARGFHRSDQAWYAKANRYADPSFLVGMYSDKGGTTGEFRVRRTRTGWRLEAYSDAWAVLTAAFADLLAELARVGDDIDADALQAWMVEHGITDLTEREEPGSAP